MTITIFDSIGRKKWFGQSSEELWNKKLEVNEFGIYFLVVQIGQQIFNKKIIISDY